MAPGPESQSFQAHSYGETVLPPNFRGAWRVSALTKSCLHDSIPQWRLRPSAASLASPWSSASRLPASPPRPSSFSSEGPRREAPRAVGAILDLSGWDFRRDGPVSLAGEWAFYPGELLDAAGATTQAAARVAPIPGAARKRAAPQVWAPEPIAFACCSARSRSNWESALPPSRLPMSSTRTASR